eukprot:g1278.t1
MKKEEEEEEKETETNTTTNAKKIPTKEEEEEDAKVEENENEIPLSSLGKMLESTTSQCVLLFFIFLDVSLTVLAMLMDANAMESTYVVRIAIEAMLLLNLFVFVSEIVALVSVFHYRLLGHIGYIVDILIVGGILYKTVTQSSESSAAFMLRLVGVVRFWRVLRIYYTDLNASKEEVEIALTRVAEVEAEIAKLRMDYDRARNEAKKEIDARRHVEGMLSEYKDRVDYLTEALTIAATTVARAQQREGNEETEEDKKESVATTGTSSPRTLPGIVVSASGSYEIKAKNTRRRRRRKKSP